MQWFLVKTPFLAFYHWYLRKCRYGMFEIIDEISEKVDFNTQKSSSYPPSPLKDKQAT